jgi:hypothetical protein
MGGKGRALRSIAVNLTAGLNYRLARSARGGCGKRGPAPLLSAGLLRRGLAQLLEAQREVRREESHIFAQPA